MSFRLPPVDDFRDFTLGLCQHCWEEFIDEHGLCPACDEPEVSYFQQLINAASQPIAEQVEDNVPYSLRVLDSNRPRTIY